jgi:hypothetical protein
MLTSEAYKYLVHYTSSVGFRGIISSSVLWATNARHLNDATEIKHYFDERLPKRIHVTVRNCLLKLATRPDVLADIANHGGFERVVALQTEAVVNSLRAATFSVNDPFIASMCGAKDTRILRNGMLSQWRAYGVDGGYAIVFDADKIEAKLTQEFNEHHYIHLQVADVFYEDETSPTQPASEDFKDLEATLDAGVERLLTTGSLKDSEGFHAAVTSLSCLCKHWGFSEEKEVRIVAVPASKLIRDKETSPLKPEKITHAFTKDQTQVPYIKLFEGPRENDSARRLPIAHVVVGPHRESAQRAAAAKELLLQSGYDVPVVVSTIPYLGMQ